jgi:DNA-binding transcriptional LysR family regulator
MKRTRDLPAELRLGDVTTFFAVHRCGSVTGAARALGTSPSHVSKAVSRLEAQLRLTLLTRGVHGVALTDGALRILPDLERAMAALSHAINVERDETRALTVAGPSWMIALFLPAIAEAQAHLRFSGLELPPAMLRAHVAENFFDLCLIAGRANLPAAWLVREIGPLELGLVARPELARKLGPGPVSIEKLRPVPFITPVYTVNGQFVQADDDCPLPYSERRLGHKVQTIHVALEVATRVDQVVFGPLLASRDHVARNLLVDVPVKGWRVTSALALACNPERLLAQEHNAIVETMQRSLRRLA